MIDVNEEELVEVFKELIKANKPSRQFEILNKNSFIRIPAEAGIYKIIKTDTAIIIKKKEGIQ